MSNQKSSDIKHTICFSLLKLLKSSLETGELHLPRKELLVQGAELRAVYTTKLPSFQFFTGKKIPRHFGQYIT